jgi:hypothetical protein
VKRKYDSQDDMLKTFVRMCQGDGSQPCASLQSIKCVERRNSGSIR